MSVSVWTRSTISRHGQRGSFGSTSRSCYGNLASNGPNNGIIQTLRRDAQQEGKPPGWNVRNARAFASAISKSAVNRLKHPSSSRSSDDASDMRGVGPGMARRIGGSLAKAENSELSYARTAREVAEENRQNAIHVLKTIPGIAPVLASNLVDAGCRTLLELRQPYFYNKLPSSVRVALDFIEHTRSSVTREQAVIVTDFVRDHISSRFEVLPVGGYRRQASECSDVEILLFHPSHVHVPTPSQPTPSLSKCRVGRMPVPFFTRYTKVAVREHSLFLVDVVQPLIARGLIAGSMTSGAQKWQGIVRMPETDPLTQWGDRADRIRRIKNKEGVFLRVDLNFAPMKSRGAALLALTGDTEFNRMLRKRALERGMYLNEFGLWRWQRRDRKAEDRMLAGESEEENSLQGYWELVKAETEMEIFSALEMDYVEPQDRKTSRSM
ncbi:hypothetical protein B0H21DRAFT_326142 [Amylocystis lapponica]|nr:hypothetical protein B0H21DRAFT_326142 [Amylocystis lapponica]